MQMAVEGVEPPTLRIWAVCSNRLSYTAGCKDFNQIARLSQSKVHRSSSIFSKLLSLKQESGQLIRKHLGAKINLIVWIRSLQIFNAIPLRFSRRLRNFPRPWVKHAQRPTTSDSLEKPHQKAKSSMSLNPYNQIYQAYFQLSIYVCIILLTWIIHESRLP